MTELFRTLVKDKPLSIIAGLVIDARVRLSCFSPLGSSVGVNLFIDLLSIRGRGHRPRVRYD